MTIISILAAVSLSAVTRVRVKSKTQRARLEIARIVAAVTDYENTYGQYPISSQASRTADSFRDDMTYGGVLEETQTWVAGPGYLTNNAEPMAPLLDLEYYGDGAPTINWAHRKNPQRIKFLELQFAPGTNAAPGLGVDGQFRDPWSSPYVITLDLNRDGRTWDAMYRKLEVSQDPSNPARGLCGLKRGHDGQGKPVFEAPVPVLVWSAGPDRHLDTTQRANTGVNRDNILSWVY